MDGLDLRILRSMGTDPYPPKPQDPGIFKASALAKNVGATPKTVRDRLAKMERQGLLRGYQIVPNHHHFGVAGACYYFRLQDEAQVEKAIVALENVDGVLGMALYLGAVFCIDLTYRNAADHERKEKLLQALAGQGTFLRYYEYQTPAPKRALTNLDWRIIQALRGNALRPLEEVASEVGVSAKTAKRRFDRIMGDGSAFIQPRVDWGQATGFIPFVLNFHLKPGSTKEALAPILQAFDERYLFGCVPAAEQLGNYALQLFAFSVAEIEELKRTALSLRGVERVEALIMRGMRGNPDWMADAITQKVQQTAKPMVAAV